MFQKCRRSPVSSVFYGSSLLPLTPTRIDSRLGPIFFLCPLQNDAHSRLSFFKQLIIVCGSSTIQYCVVIWHCAVSASNCSVEHVIWCYPEHKESVWFGFESSQFMTCFPFFLKAILNRQKIKFPGPDTTPTEIRAFSTACFLPKNSILGDICDAVFPDGEKGELFAWIDSTIKVEKYRNIFCWKCYCC